MNDNYFKNIVDFIRELYNKPEGIIPIHSPVFKGNEKKYLNDCLETTFVSYVGEYVKRFEEMTSEYLGAKYSVAIVNGTAALQIALLVAGVKQGDLVLTQALTFVATANAITHAGADPIFIDIEKHNLGMCPEKLHEFLRVECHKTTGADGREYLVHTLSGRKITACVPVHVFGHPCKIEDIIQICDSFQIPVIEDAAEAIGSTRNGKHMGTYGLLGILSYNGNKIITTGGGGMIITDKSELARRAKHITTTAKVDHAYEYNHDEIAFNYRLTNLQAAIGCAQMEQLESYLTIKRKIAELYANYFEDKPTTFLKEISDNRSNYWLNSILLRNREERDEFLKYTNEHGVTTRPAWCLMNKLPIYKHCIKTSLDNSEWIEDRLVNLPSSVIIK